MNTTVSRRTFVAAGAAAGAAMALPLPARARPRAPVSALPPVAGIDTSQPEQLAAVELAALLHARKVSSVELTGLFLDRIAALQPALNSWVRVYPDRALAAAREADRRLHRGKAPLICGLPIGLKDLYAVGGLPLTASSKVLDGNVATGDSTVWAKLARAGLVLLGHTHTDEFAFGVGTPQTGNPWDPTLSPGGSSGGSGSALGARMTPLATGTDTGGSLRSPAAACGVSSIKPSFGRVSAHGVIPLLWSRDHAGPMGKSLADCALLLSSMAGADEHDPATLTLPEPPDLYPLTGPASLTGKRIGVTPAAADGSGVPSQCLKLWQAFLADLQALGAELVKVDDPGAGPSGSGEYAEAWAYHRQFGPEAVAKYRPEVAATNVLATLAEQGSAPMLDYVTFQRSRLAYAHAWVEHFHKNTLDAVVKPGSSAHAATRQELAGLTYVGSGSVGGDYRWANHAGVPVATTPVGLSDAGLPWAVQIGGHPRGEEDLLPIALAYQAAHPHWRLAPKEDDQ